MFQTLFLESFRFAWQALVANKLRSLLSLLGITIGIFSVISVFTLVDSWEYKINQSFAKFGSEILYIQKWPMEFKDDYPWWKYLSRPLPTLREFQRIENKLESAEAVCYMAATRANRVKHGSFEMKNIRVAGVTSNYPIMREMDISEGRFPASSEFKSGSRVCVIGQTIKEDLFNGKNPIGQSISLLNTKFVVVGVFAKEGENVLDNTLDNQIVVPAIPFLRFTNLDDFNSEQLIMVKGKGNVPYDEMKYEVKGEMRSLRKLRPGKDDNFALNNMSMVTTFISGFFQQIWILGLIIGGFALLVGGFGIANIMFVSVWERTGQIGIQKALGAKSQFILLQFLFESVLLSLAGGILGLGFVSLIVFAINSFTDWGIFLSLKNILISTGISGLIGLLAGLLPAAKAANMNPVEAIRQNQ
jgi:putative ABC transport system permease protein